MAESTVDGGNEQEWNATTWKKREAQRDELRSIIFQARDSGETDKMKSAISLLEGDELSYRFDEKSFDKDYVSALYRGKKRKTGEDVKVDIKTTKELIENDHEFFNMVKDGSLVMAGVTLIDVVANYSEAEKADMLRRLQSYEKTSSFGKGSRGFGEQLAGVASGVGVDIVTTGGLATLYKLLTKPVTHKLEGEMLKKVLSPNQKMAAGGGAYGSVADLEQQGIEMQLDENQEFSPTRNIISAGVSAVTPLAGKPAGKIVGKVVRPILHPAQSTTTMFKKMPWVGGLAATKQLQDAFDAVDLRGVDMESGSAQMAFKIKNIFKNADNAISGQYKNLGLNVDRNALESIVRNAQKRGDTIPDSVLDVIKSLQSTQRPLGGYGGGKGSYVESTVRVDAALRKMKTKLWEAKQDAVRKGESATGNKYNKLRRELIDLEELSAKKMGREKYDTYMGLKKDVETFAQLQETEMGGKLYKVWGQSGEDAVKGVEKMMDEMTSGTYAWGKYKSFMTSLEKYGNIEGRTKAGSSLKKEIQESVGFFLTQNKGKRLIELLHNPDARGMKLLKAVYPDDIKTWDGLEALASKMAKSTGSAKKMGDSVIANMVVARLGSKLGGSIGGDVGAGAGAITGIMGISQLLNSKFFQNAAVHALNNDGRMSTVTRSWLRKKGYTGKDINAMTDAFMGLPFAGYAQGYFDEIWEKNKDQLDARIEEIRQGFLF
ncbi:MAG: hypothetical protein HOE35_00695 [Candidatus Ruthia sp.]|nr:hypothetical protein [Candidatus Ruthturnera sp.]